MIIITTLIITFTHIGICIYYNVLKEFPSAQQCCIYLHEGGGLKNGHKILFYKLINLK